MKILTAAEMQAAEQLTFTSLPIESKLVMEKAGEAVVDVVLRVAKDKIQAGVVVIVGSGNNGGDGYVVARLLLKRSIPVKVWAFKAEAELKGDALINCVAWKEIGGVIEDLTGKGFANADLLSPAQEQFLSQAGVVVDALYGTGFRDKMPAAQLKLVTRINELCAANSVTVVAVDIPSGVNATTGAVFGAAINASHTAALQALKLGHVLYPGSEYCGKVSVEDIGVIGTEQIDRELLTAKEVLPILDNFFKPNSQGYKGSKGHVAAIGGDSEHFGAVRLSANSALSCGAGLVTMIVPKGLEGLVSPGNFELMCSGLNSDANGSFSRDAAKQLQQKLEDKDAMVLGPGMGQGEGAVEVTKEVYRIASDLKVPVVIDADALNVTAANLDIRKTVPIGSVLTPHPGEMARLLNCSTKEVQDNRLNLTVQLAAELKSWVLLKGARSIIAGPNGQVRINPAATEVLGTAGSGDTLAGVIAAFLARGMSAETALCAGVYLHGLAGEVLEAERGGVAGVKAGDISNCIAWLINNRNLLLDSNQNNNEHVLPLSVNRLTLEKLVNSFKSSVLSVSSR